MVQVECADYLTAGLTQAGFLDSDVASDLEAIGDAILEAAEWAIENFSVTRHDPGDRAVKTRVSIREAENGE